MTSNAATGDAMTEELTITVPDDAPADRLDRFLASGLESGEPLSRTRIKALILDGAVTEDGKVASDPAATIRAGAIDVALHHRAKEATKAFAQRRELVGDVPALTIRK